MPYLLSTRHEDMQLSAVYDLLSASYWSTNIRRDVVEVAIANSRVIGAFLPDAQDSTRLGTQVAFARAVTDQATFAWLCDVIVHPDHRGGGVGKLMLEHFFAQPWTKTLRRWCLATRDAQDLYRRYGFTEVDAARWMEWKQPASNWQSPPR